MHQRCQRRLWLFAWIHTCSMAEHTTVTIKQCLRNPPKKSPQEDECKRLNSLSNCLWSLAHGREADCNTPDNMISIRSPRHKLLSSPLSSLTSSAERRITSSAYYPRITEPSPACWFVSSGVLTITISLQCPALQKTESSVKVKLKDTPRRQYVPSAGASTRSNRPPPHRAPRKSP